MRRAATNTRLASDRPRPSKGRYLERRDVVYAHRLRGEVWLAIASADERAIARCLMPDDVDQRLAVRKDLARLRDALELRRIAPNRLELLLELIADVDHESGLLVILA